MARTTRTLVALACLATALSGCAGPSTHPLPTSAPVDALILYDWPDDLPQSVLSAFTAETGIAITYRTYSSMEEAVDNLEAGHSFDVVNLDNRFIPGLIAGGFLARLDPLRLPNLKNISPNFRDLIYDPGNRYTVPYNWGTTGLVVRADLVSPPVHLWADLWDSAFAGRLALYQSQPREVLALALKSLGFSANSEHPQELEAAQARLQQLAPRVHWIKTDVDDLATQLSSGDVLVGMGYAGDVLLSRERGLTVTYVLPDEGALLWGENLVIPANAAHREAALRFLDFVLRPEVAAEIADQNFYATSNEAALPLIAPEVRTDPVIFPPNTALRNAEIILPLSPAGQTLYDRVWSAVMSAATP